MVGGHCVSEVSSAFGNGALQSLGGNMYDMLDHGAETANEPKVSVSNHSVSVVIATRNRPVLLRQAIDSVVSQEHDAPIEILVVFDQSEPDKSLEKSDGSTRIRAIENSRSAGLAGARNSGILVASHEWIAFCDDDDEWLPGKLSGQFSSIEKMPEARAACTGIVVASQGKKTVRIPDQERMSFDDFLEDRMAEVHPSSWMVHADTLRDRIGLVDEDIPGGYAEDYDLMLRTAREFSISVTPEPLVQVNWTGSSFFFERWKMIEESLTYLLEKYPEFESNRAGYARMLGHRATAHAAMGDRKTALRDVSRAFQSHKTQIRVPVALALIAGFPPNLALRIAHRFGKGI